MNPSRSWILTAASFLGIATAIGFSAELPAGFPGCKKPWVFFDLGNTLISAQEGKESRYIPGAHEYLRELKRRGYPVGLISNIPEKWGSTRRTKIRELKRIIAESWTKEIGAEKMDWNDFPDPLIIIPFRDKDRKPAAYLYQFAISRVEREEGTTCPVVYQGENVKEVEAATKYGMRGYLALKNPDAPFLPFEELEKL
jgi:FMN phosphatase YigB (HAD superfamily)